MTIFNIKLISTNLGIFPAIAGNCPRSVEKPAIARMFNLGKFRVIGRVPRGTPCYSTENAEIFYHSVSLPRSAPPPAPLPSTAQPCCRRLVLWSWFCDLFSVIILYTLCLTVVYATLHVKKCKKMLNKKWCCELWLKDRLRQDLLLCPPPQVHSWISRRWINTTKGNFI